MLASFCTAERVRDLEAKLPNLQQRLNLQNGSTYDRQPLQDQHSLVGRVEALEEAMDVLVTAQVFLLPAILD